MGAHGVYIFLFPPQKCPKLQGPSCTVWWKLLTCSGYEGDVMIFPSKLGSLKNWGRIPLYLPLRPKARQQDAPQFWWAPKKERMCFSIATTFSPGQIVYIRFEGTLVAPTNSGGRKWNLQICTETRCRVFSLFVILVGDTRCVMPPLTMIFSLPGWHHIVQGVGIPVHKPSLDTGKGGNLRYCWWKKSGGHQLRLVVYPITFRVSHIPGGEEFLPSTVAFVNHTMCLGDRWYTCVLLEGSNFNASPQYIVSNQGHTITYMPFISIHTSSQIM